MAVLAPIPSARGRVETIANPGFLTSTRAPKRISCAIDIICLLIGLRLTRFGSRLIFGSDEAGGRVGYGLWAKCASVKSGGLHAAYRLRVFHEGLPDKVGPEI